MKTEPWWVCNVCDTKIQKVGKGLHKAFVKHKAICPLTKCGIRQVNQ